MQGAGWGRADKEKKKNWEGESEKKKNWASNGNKKAEGSFQDEKKRSKETRCSSSKNIDS